MKLGRQYRCRSTFDLKTTKGLHLLGFALICKEWHLWKSRHYLEGFALLKNKCLGLGNFLTSHSFVISQRNGVKIQITNLTILFLPELRMSSVAIFGANLSYTPDLLALKERVVKNNWPTTLGHN